VRFRALNLWHFSCNVEFNPLNIVFPNCGLILAWEILLEYLMTLWRRRISTSEWELLLLSLKITRLQIYPLDTSTPNTPCLRYVYHLHFTHPLLLYRWFPDNCRLVFLSGSPIPCISPSSSRGMSPSGCAKLTRVNSTNVLDEGLRTGEIGCQMNSKVKSVKQGVYRK
jgi:hypothetical protein